MWLWGLCKHQCASTMEGRPCNTTAPSFPLPDAGYVRQRAAREAVKTKMTAGERKRVLRRMVNDRKSEGVREKGAADRKRLNGGQRT